MSWPWASPEATRRAGGPRQAPSPGSRGPGRLYEVAFRRVLARLEAAEPGRWVLKGGVALLRLDPNRTSDDIDIAYLDAAGQQGVALAAPERALALDLGDHFSFVVLRAGPDSVRPGSTRPRPYGSRRASAAGAGSIRHRPRIHRGQHSDGARAAARLAPRRRWRRVLGLLLTDAEHGGPRRERPRRGARSRDRGHQPEPTAMRTRAAPGASRHRALALIAERGRRTERPRTPGCRPPRTR